MDPAILRFEILRLTEQHEATDTGAYLEDTVIASHLNLALADVQRQLLVLETRELVDLVKSFGPSYGTRLTPSGMEALEEANSQPAAAPRRIGF
jgi:hypothetical protein